MEKAGASVEELERFGEGKLQLGILEGDMEEGSLMAGQIAGLVKEIKPAAEIIKEIVAEAERVIARLNTSYLGVSHG
jgi:enoyl-[acyl-carrier protein] reductase II